MEVVDQDEILFAELNKQISLLIMDDDADQYLPYPPVTYQVCIIHQLMYKLCQDLRAKPSLIIHIINCAQVTSRYFVGICSSCSANYTANTSV